LKVTKRLIIQGRVQGVWYRESMRIEAERLGVAGWVRNRRDGSVEALLQGDDTAVESLIRWAWDGPPAARVDAVQVSEGNGEFSGFERWPTA